MRNEPVQFSRNLFSGVAQLGGLGLQNRCHGLSRSLPSEGLTPRQHLVQHAAQGKDVAGSVGPLPPNLFRGHVPDRAHHRPRLGYCGLRVPDPRPPAPGPHPCHPAIRGHEDVFRLQVPVDDALGMRGGETVRHGYADFHRLAPGQRRAAEAVAQRLALQQLGDGVGEALLRAEIMDGQYVRMRQRRHSFGLPLKTGQGLRVFGHMLRQDLDRHVPAQPGVPRAIDLSHPPGPDGRHDFIRAETDAGAQCHGAIVAQGARGRGPSPPPPGPWHTWNCCCLDYPWRSPSLENEWKAKLQQLFPEKYYGSRYLSRSLGRNP